MAGRRKAAAQDAPQGREAAIAAIARYRELVARVDQEGANTGAAIAALQSASAERLALLEAEAKALFAGLRTFWASSAALFTEGKHRSAVVAGVEIGQRRTPHALKLPKGKSAKELLQAMLSGGFIGWLRPKWELKRDDIVATITRDPEHDLAVKMGFAVESKDEFFMAVRPLEAATEEENTPA